MTSVKGTAGQHVYPCLRALSPGEVPEQRKGLCQHRRRTTQQHPPAVRHWALHTAEQTQTAISALPVIRTSCKAAAAILSDWWPCRVLIEPGCAQSAHGWHAHAQVSTKLKVGVMFDHNGTYMEGFGFAYRELQVTVEIADNDELAVTLNGKALQLPQSQADLEVIPYVERGEFLLLWQRHREGLGNAVELTTGTLAAHKCVNLELCLHKLHLYACAEHPVLLDQLFNARCTCRSGFCAMLCCAAFIGMHIAALSMLRGEGSLTGVPVLCRPAPGSCVDHASWHH